jgi:hypothetical protein
MAMSRKYDNRGRINVLEQFFVAPRCVINRKDTFFLEALDYFFVMDKHSQNGDGPMWVFEFGPLRDFNGIDDSHAVTMGISDVNVHTR